METSVAEIHAYPVRPDGFEGPLFPTRESRLAVAEHLLGAPWLERASELVGSGNGGRTARTRREPVELCGDPGRVGISWSSGRGGRKKRRLIVRELDRWREVGRWWDEATRVDRHVLKVLLSNGSVVDLSRENQGKGGPQRWFLVGVED